MKTLYLASFFSLSMLLKITSPFKSVIIILIGIFAMFLSVNYCVILTIPITEFSKLRIEAINALEYSYV